MKENVIEIWQPRYKDNMVLIATYKVKSGYNYVRFTKAKHLEGKLYRFHSTDINTNNVQQNGKALMFILPMEKLQLVEEKTESKSTDIHDVKVTIDGKTREFTSVQEVIDALSMYLARGRGASEQ